MATAQVVRLASKLFDTWVVRTLCSQRLANLELQHQAKSFTSWAIGINFQAVLLGFMCQLLVLSMNTAVVSSHCQDSKNCCETHQGQLARPGRARAE